MSKRDDGGPAYPVGNGGMKNLVGMTLLDWYAGQALMGIYSNPGTVGTVEEMAPGVAAAAYAAADAMIAEKRRREAGEPAGRE